MPAIEGLWGTASYTHNKKYEYHLSTLYQHIFINTKSVKRMLSIHKFYSKDVTQGVNLSPMVRARDVIYPKLVWLINEYAPKWHRWLQYFQAITEPLFTKRQDVLSPDLAKHRSREIRS